MTLLRSFVAVHSQFYTFRPHGKSYVREFVGHNADSFKFLLKKGSNICTTVNGSTVLMEAVNRNRLDFVDYLVCNADKLGLNLSVRDRKGCNVLFYAAAVGNPDIFERLVKAGCVVEADLNGRTVFLQAALHGHIEMMRYLVKNSDSLALKTQQADNDGRNALFYGIESGHMDVLLYLISLGIKCRTDKGSKTNLMQSARAGNIIMTNYLLENSQALDLDITYRDIRGENALFYAVRSRRAAVVSILMDRGLVIVDNDQGLNIISLSLAHGLDDVIDVILNRTSDVKGAVLAKDSKGRTSLHHFVDRGDIVRLKRYGSHYSRECDTDLTGTTLVMCACKSNASDDNKVEIIKYLVEELHASVDSVDSRNRCALFYAVESGSIPVTSYMLTRTNTVTSDNNGLTLLMVAVVTGNQAMVGEILRSKFARDVLDKVDRNGRNEVHYCAMHNCKAILLDLLACHRLHVDHKDTHGKSPLMYACENGRFATVSCLLKRGGARVDVIDNEGRNALHHCLTGTNPSLHCARLLVQKGIDVNLRDQTGVTPLMLACQMCAKTHIAVIRFLIEQGADPILQDSEGSDAFDYCPFDSEYVKGVLRERSEMKPAERDTLTSHVDELTEGLHINSVLRGLLKEGVFTKTLNFEVMKQAPTDRVRKMIDILSSRGERAFRAFCNVLKKEGEIEIAYLIQKEAYRKVPEIYW